jgi:hypothetical protein
MFSGRSMPVEMSLGRSVVGRSVKVPVLRPDYSHIALHNTCMEKNHGTTYGL